MLCFWDDIERRSRYRILITSILLESKIIYLKDTMLAEKDTPAFFGTGHVEVSAMFQAGLIEHVHLSVDIGSSNF